MSASLAAGALLGESVYLSRREYPHRALTVRACVRRLAARGRAASCERFPGKAIVLPGPFPEEFHGHPEPGVCHTGDDESRVPTWRTPHDRLP